MGMTVKFKASKVTAWPSTPEPHKWYIKKAPSDSYAEIAYTDASGTLFGMGNSEMIGALVDTKLQGLADQIVIKANDIAARDLAAASLGNNALFLVVDATADPDNDIENGAAFYFWDDAAEEFTFISEFESMNLQITWEDITNGPNSSPQDIDTAVQNSHNHSNKTVLDKLDIDGDGDLLIDGVPAQKINANW